MPDEGSELKRMKDLEKQIIREIEERAKLEKLEAQAKDEIKYTAGPAVASGSAERRLLLFAAVVIIIFMPFLYPAEGIFLSVFTIVITVFAGLTASRKAPAFNLFISVGGVLLFQFAAIYEFHARGRTALFWADELLALVFLFATYFSVKTYRIHREIKEEHEGFAEKRRLHAMRQEEIEKEESGG